MVQPQECVWAGPWQPSSSAGWNCHISAETKKGVTKNWSLSLSQGLKCQSHVKPRAGLSEYLRVTILSTLRNHHPAEGLGPALSTYFSPSNSSCFCQVINRNSLLQSDVVTSAVNSNSLFLKLRKVVRIKMQQPQN